MTMKHLLRRRKIEIGNNKTVEQKIKSHQCLHRHHIMKHRPLKLQQHLSLFDVILQDEQTNKKLIIEDRNTDKRNFRWWWIPPRHNILQQTATILVGPLIGIPKERNL